MSSKKEKATTDPKIILQWLAELENEDNPIENHSQANEQPVQHELEFENTTYVVHPCEGK